MKTRPGTDLEGTHIVSAVKADGAVGADELIAAFLSGRSKATVEAYRTDLRDFSAFIGCGSVTEAARSLLAVVHGQANLLALRFRAHLLDEQKLGASSVNRKLAALRSLVKLANTLGMCDWHLQVPNLQSEKYGNVTGIGVHAVKRLLRLAGSGRGTKAVRDQAIVRLLYDLALRRAEACSLDLSDLDLAGKAIHVLGKGRSQKVRMSLPDQTCDALTAWLRKRGNEPGPLFVSFDHRLQRQNRRLTPCGLYDMVRRLGKRAGIKVHPHQIRHTSITEAVKSSVDSGISLDEVTQFSRHRDVGTLLIYRDSERNVQGQLAGLVAGKV